MKLIPDSIDISEYLREPDPSEAVRPASHWAAEVRDFFFLGESQEGATLPWPKTEQLFRFREGEVTLWPGINGHGKSLVTTQVALGFCEQGEKVCLASFEMKPKKTMIRMTRQASGGAEPSMRFISKFNAWTDGRLWIFDHVGSIHPDRVLGVLRWSVDRLGIRHFFIDSLMKCVRGEDDYNGQKDFVTQVCAVAQDSGVHVHLVHHTRKLADEGQQPGKFDAKGSGSITDQVDNVLTVWRNKVKERRIADDVFESAEEREEERSKPDAVLICDKQRNGDWEGKIGLWVNPGAMSFRGDARPMMSLGMDFPEDPPRERQPGDDDE